MGHYSWWMNGIIGGDDPIVDLNDLHIFRMVAEDGSLSLAARDLGYVQSNVTTRLRKLEEMVGQRLLDRHSRGVRLTPAGHLLLDYAERILSLWNEAQQALLVHVEPRGPLLLGTLESTAAARLPDVLLRFHRQWPAVTIHLQTDTTTDLVTAVRQGKLDLALVAGPVTREEIEAVPVWEEDLVIVTAAVKELPWTGGVEELGMLLFRTGCTYRARFETWWIRHALPRPRVLELGSIDALMHLAAAGIGIALVPKSVATSAVAAGRLRMHAIDPDLTKVAIYAVTCSRRSLSSAASAFLQCLGEDREQSPETVAGQPELPL